MVVQLLLRNQFVCDCTELPFSKVITITLKKVMCSLKIMGLVLHFLKLLSRQLPNSLIMMGYYFTFCINIFSTNIFNDCLL